MEIQSPAKAMPPVGAEGGRSLGGDLAVNTRGRWTEMETQVELTRPETRTGDRAGAAATSV